MGPAPCLAMLGRVSGICSLAEQAGLIQTWQDLQSKHGLMGPAQLVLGGIFLVLVHTRSLDGEHKVCVGKGTVRALALAMASLSDLCAFFCARLGGFKSNVNHSHCSKILPSLLAPSRTDPAGRRVVLISA